MDKKINEINRKIGIRIKIERYNRKISQERLAELSELNRTTIGSVERGEISPTIETLYKIAAALDIELHDLVNITKINIQNFYIKSNRRTKKL